MTFISQACCALFFATVLAAPVTVPLGPRPQPMLMARGLACGRDDDDDGGPNGGLRVVRVPGAQSRARDLSFQKCFGMMPFLWPTLLQSKT